MIEFLFQGNGVKRAVIFAVILKMYYMPNDLTSLIHKKIHQIFRDAGGKMKK